MEARKVKRWLVYLITAIIACIVIVLVWSNVKADTRATAIADRQRSKRFELQQARALWEARSFANYRLLIQNGLPNPYGFGNPFCEKVYQVNEPAQPKKLSDTCDPQLSSYERYAPIDRGSVPDLFDYIEIRIDHVGECGPNGCDCDGGMTLDVIYDGDRGYPKRVEERVERFWPMPEPSTPCSAMAPIVPDPFTVSVTPIE